MIEDLEEEKFLQTCALTARFFQIDPIIVASAPDYFTFAFRQAAYNYVTEKERQAEEKRAAAARANSSRR